MQVQRWLGHHKPSFTLDTYVHLLEADVPTPEFFDELGHSSNGTGGKRSEHLGGDIAADAEDAVAEALPLRALVR